MPYYSLTIGTSELMLTEANGIHGVRVSGAGMPPIRNVRTPYALMDGALFQRAVVQERVIVLSMLVQGATLQGLMTARKSLVDAVNGHVAETFKLRYYFPVPESTDDYVEMTCVYDGGLDGSEQPTFYERLGLRLLAVDPFWHASSDATGALVGRVETAYVQNIVWLKNDGTVDDLNRGLYNAYTLEQVTAITRTPGKIQAFGDFWTAFNSIQLQGAAEYTETEGQWAALAIPWSSVTGWIEGGVVESVVQGPGILYLSGNCMVTGPVLKYVFFTYDGTTWTWADANRIYTMTVGPNGYVWAASSGVGGLCVEFWNGTVWTRVTTWASSGSYNALSVSQDGTVYVGGSFAAIDGVTAANIAKYNPTTDTWSALGAGAPYVVSKLAIATNGEIYAAIAENTMAQVWVTHVHRWNGVAFVKIAGEGAEGFIGIVSQLTWTDDGLLVVYDAQGLPTISGAAYWRGNRWFDLGIGYEDGPEIITVVSLGDSGAVLGGTFQPGTWISPGITSIDNAGNAKAYPIITLTGPGRVYSLTNFTTGQRLDFDLTILADEVVTLDLRQGIKTITSSFRGNILYAITSGSLINWHLAPGANSISLWFDNAAASAGYVFAPRYWSNDMAAPA